MKLLTDFILVSGIIMNLMILFLLFKKQNKQLSTLVLLLIFGFMLAVNINTYANLHELKWLFISSFVLDDMAVWVLGPLLVIYIKSLFLNGKDLFINHWQHFIPAMVYFIVVSLPIFISFLIGGYVFRYLSIIGDFSYLYVLIRDVYMLLYLGYSLKLFYDLRTVMKSQVSTFTQENIGWIKHLIYGCTLLICVDILTEIYELIFGEVNFNTGYITVVLMVIFVAYLGYYGTLRSEILLPLPIQVNNSLEVNGRNKSTLSVSDRQLLQGKLNAALVNEKPYLEEKLTLTMLADLIETTDKKLSTLLNQHLNKSFYQLINEHRIKHVCEQLVDPKFKKSGIMTVAYQSGFNSKTTFNRLFKNATGLSPSQYRKQGLDVQFEGK